MSHINRKFRRQARRKEVSTGFHEDVPFVPFHLLMAQGPAREWRSVLPRIVRAVVVPTEVTSES